MGADSIYDEEELPIGGEQGKPQAAEAVTDHMPYANVSGKEIASGTRTTAKNGWLGCRGSHQQRWRVRGGERKRRICGR